MSLIVIWLGWTPPTLTPGSRGVKRGPSGVLEPQPCILAKTSSNESCCAPPDQWGQVTLQDPKFRSGRTWAQCDSLPGGVYKIKVVVNVPNSAWPEGQGIGLEGQCLAIPHTLVIILTLTTTYFLKTSFESSRAMPGNPSQSYILWLQGKSRISMFPPKIVL